MWDVILFDHSHIYYKTLKPDTVHGKKKWRDIMQNALVLNT